MVAPLEFEKSIHAVESKLEELMHITTNGDLNISGEITKLKSKMEKMLHNTYTKLSPWQKVLVARHPERPCFSEYVDHFIDDFTELAGDRNFAEDKAIIGGLGRFRGRSVVIIGHQKGRDTESRIKHNFGMPRPEGYRKAKRLFELADQFELPIITLVDTAGAHPGIDAEERGQAEAIAASIEALTRVKVPVVTIITGEGGSGGAIALAVANTVNMLEHSIYSVISPEGCATILWRTADKKELAAQAQKLTAQDLIKYKVIDHIITEPLGGAHRDNQATCEAVGKQIEMDLRSLSMMSGEELRKHREDKFLAMGRNI
ncbi:MAG: acetyl-CoA carboxylase carboxyltransferase subunit alpha [Alphaproteobacteria bacterium]